MLIKVQTAIVLEQLKQTYNVSIFINPSTEIMISPSINNYGDLHLSTRKLVE